MLEKENNYHVCKVRIEKSVTLDQCSVLLGKPRDAAQWSSCPLHTPMKAAYNTEWIDLR